jgi:hypothetical protein
LSAAPFRWHDHAIPARNQPARNKKPLIKITATMKRAGVTALNGVPEMSPEGLAAEIYRAMAAKAASRFNMVTDDELAGVLAALLQWESENPTGRDFTLFLTLCTWLPRGAAAKPVGSLYKQPRYSEPILRKAQQDLVQSGYATIVADPLDLRRCLVRASPLLQEKLEEWRTRLPTLTNSAEPALD